MWNLICQEKHREREHSGTTMVSTPLSAAPYAKLCTKGAVMGSLLNQSSNEME